MAASIAEVAREAYAAGWALSGGPMTSRVAAGCQAAVAHALEHPGEPGVLEVSLHLGHLEGTWAEVYRRREAMTADHVARVTAAWRRLVRKLRPRDLIADYQRVITHPFEAAQEHPEAWQRAAARAAALAWLYRILSDPRYGDLAQEMTGALMDAAAEGKTAALAVAADQAAALGFSWDKAYKAMRAGLTDVEGVQGLSASWVREIIGAAAGDAARVLATMPATDASDSEIAAGIMDAVDGEDVRAVRLVTDFAIGRSMAQAALDLYTSEGVLTAWLTAGDGRVCASCDANEENGPYQPWEFPQCPDHYACRCCPTPAQPLPVSAFAQFLVPVG